jgi:hypothetical protein
MPAERTTHFLNVDFDLIATVDVDPLLAQLTPKAVVLHDLRRGKTRTLVLELPNPSRTLDQMLLKFTALIEALPRPARARWNQCKDRCANIGIQAGLMPHAASFIASPKAIAALARIGMRIELTIYGAARTPDPS